MQSEEDKTTEVLSMEGVLYPAHSIDCDCENISKIFYIYATSKVLQDLLKRKEGTKIKDFSLILHNSSYSELFNYALRLAFIAQKDQETYKDIEKVFLEAIGKFKEKQSIAKNKKELKEYDEKIMEVYLNRIKNTVDSWPVFAYFNGYLKEERDYYSLVRRLSNFER